MLTLVVPQERCRARLNNCPDPAFCLHCCCTYRASSYIIRASAATMTVITAIRATPFRLLELHALPGCMFNQTAVVLLNQVALIILPLGVVFKALVGRFLLQESYFLIWQADSVSGNHIQGSGRQILPPKNSRRVPMNSVRDLLSPARLEKKVKVP